MVDSTIADARYTYIHDDQNGLLQAIDTHHIVIRRNASMGFLVKLSALLLLLLVANPLFLFLIKDKSVTTIIWSLLLGAVVVKLFFRRHVEKESVIIMPSFGVQLETHYKSGRTIHRFIPINKILKAVLNECVTPVTCYWSLSLLVHGEEQLLLVFKELRPPAKMLIPIWKALCSAADGKESADTLK